MVINKKNIGNLFCIFLIVHLIIWTAIPTFTNNNLPLDTIEALAWGSNLDWGFNKHPPMSAFLVEIFYQIFGAQDWTYYLLSQICVIISFFIIWNFSKEFLKNENYGLLSILLLEGIYFYNYTTPEFNVYVCELPFWSLTVFYCWKGFKNNKYTDWLLFGIFAATGILSHYLFIYLLLSFDVFFLYMIYKKKINFKCFISLIPFLLIITPHLIWLVENNYTTITYGLHRTGTGEQNFLDHIIHPLIFLGKQIGILIPFFFMLLFLINKFKTKFNFKDKKLLFLLVINIVPIILVFLTSMIMGVKIKTMWMTPFYLFFGVLVIYIFQSQINLNKLKGFTTAFIVLFIFSPFAYAYVSITETNKRTDYGGKQIAEEIEIIWKTKYASEIDLVIGDEWYGGNFSYHLSSRPQWMPDYETTLTPEDWKKKWPKNFKGGYIVIRNTPVCIFHGFYPTLEFESQENTTLYICTKEIK